MTKGPVRGSALPLTLLVSVFTDHRRRHRMREEKPKRRTHEDEESFEPEPLGADRREKLDEDTEELLDEIDDVLEENAAEFVHSYIQKGGE